MKRAASPGAVSFVQFKKTAIVPKIHTARILIIIAHLHCILIKKQFLSCAEKYLLNEHESATFFSVLFYYDFSVILIRYFVCGSEQFSANINRNNMLMNVIFIVYLAFVKMFRFWIGKIERTSEPHPHHILLLRGACWIGAPRTKPRGTACLETALYECCMLMFCLLLRL
jgi:hypothetical protein